MARAWEWLRWSDVIAMIAEDGASRIDDDAMDVLLWEHTAYPMLDPAGVYRQLATVLLHQRDH